MLRIVNQIKSSLQYVPLKQINIESTICSFTADITITQIFQNTEHTSIDIIYCFPIEEQAAIYNFTAYIDNKDILVELKEKKIQYNNILQEKQINYLLEQDNFIINLGILPSLKECIIKISYVTELDFIQESIIRFVIPTTIAPQYNYQKQDNKLKYIQSNPYTIEFRCRVEKITEHNQQQYITRLYSPSHHINVDPSLQDAYIITFTQKNIYLDRDILLDIKLSDKRVNTFVIMESNAAMAVVTPFENDCYLTLYNELTYEFIFILDCSGSMKNENKIGLIREIMFFFLKNLPNNSYFNIIKFGAKYICLFNESTAFYNNIHVRIAEKFINQIQADLGTTEILAPLQWLKRHPPKNDRARQVFFLTDGKVSNVSEILELSRSISSSIRIFSFGLGTSPNRSLIKGLAHTTNGRFIFIPPNTYTDIYVEEQLQKALGRCITNVHVKWNLGISVENVPNQLPPVYMNDRLIIYALTNKQTIPLNHKSSIEIRTDQSYYRLDITESDRIITNKQMIARLAAKALMLELEHYKIPQKNFKQVRFADTDNYSKDNRIIRSKEDIKQRIIDLSLQYNILSPYTAFIGIEKDVNDSNNYTVVREIPIHRSPDNKHFQLTNSINKNSVRKTNDTILYPSILSKNQHLHNRPIGLIRTREKSSPSKHTSTNDNSNKTSYNEQQIPLEHAQLHYDSSTSMRSNTTTETHLSTLSNKHEYEQIWPMNDTDTIHYLINEQTNDGLWNFDSNRKVIQNLTGKPFAVFQSSETHGNTQILVTAIIIILLEVKFISLRSMWDNAVEKARQRLINLLNNDWKKLVMLFRNIRIILNE